MSKANTIAALLEKLGVTLTDDQKTQVAEYEKGLRSAEEVTTLKSELDGVKTQLLAANETIKGFGDSKPDELKSKIEEWEKKYNTDTEALKAQLTERETEFAAKELFSGYKFASDRTKNSVLDEFKTKGFKLENGKFVGGAEYLDALKKSEPNTFAPETDPKGVFMDKTMSTETSGNMKADIFKAFGVSAD